MKTSVIKRFTKDHWFGLWEIFVIGSDTFWYIDYQASSDTKWSALWVKNSVVPRGTKAHW